jgi:hypothetical protein
VALPGAYTPASITFRVIGARRPPLHDKVVVLEEDGAVIIKYLPAHIIIIIIIIIMAVTIYDLLD